MLAARPGRMGHRRCRPETTVEMALTSARVTPEIKAALFQIPTRQIDKHKKRRPIAAPPRLRRGRSVRPAWPLPPRAKRNFEATSRARGLGLLGQLSQRAKGALLSD